MNVETLTELGFNSYQVETLEQAHQHPEFSAAIDTALSLHESGVGDPDVIMDTLMEIIVVTNTARLKVEHDQRVAQGGFTVQGVHAEVSYAYTVGLTSLYGLELVLRCPADASTLGAVVNCVAERLKTQPMPETVFELEEFHIGGKPMRVKLMVCEDVPKLIESVATGLGNPEYMALPPEHVYQILIADAGNLLPGEDGYNQAFNQDLHHPEDIAVTSE